MKANVALITTQFSPPRLPAHSVAREHLLERLGKAYASRLIVIQGGAGYGKTTLLGQFRQQLLREGTAVAWFDLSEDDACFIQFSVDLLGSLREAGLPLPEALDALDPQAHDCVRTLAAVLINTIARVSGQLYLFIDDYQHARDPRIDSLVQLLVDRAPANLHLVIASRSQPALSLGRLRGMGDIEEIAAADLTFRFSESLNLLRGLLDESVTPSEVHTLHNLADGWPIGLQLAATTLKLQARRQIDSASLPTQAGLISYLDEEVLARQPAEVVDFLQKIAILQPFNSTLAARLSGVEEAAQLIAHLQAQNLFIFPGEHGEDQRWYRLHPLFAEHLRQRLSASGADLDPLHQRAAQFYEEAGMIGEAVKHATLCSDVNVLIALLERAQANYHRISDINQHMHWLDSVPLEQLTQHPSILLMGAWSCLLVVQAEKAQSWLAALEAVQTSTLWTAHISLIKAAIAIQQDDMDRAFALLEPLEGRKFTLPLYEQTRSTIFLNCLSYFGLHEKARHYFNAPRTAELHASTDEMALIFQATGAHAVFLEGDALEAERLAAHVLRRAEQAHGHDSVSACLSAVPLAEVLYESDRLDDAQEMVANRPGMLQYSTSTYMIRISLLQARLQYHRDNAQSAIDFLNKRISTFRILGRPRATANMLAEQVRMLLTSGDWRYAEGPYKALETLACNHLHPKTCTDAEISVLARLSQARLALAKQEPERVVAVLEALQPILDKYQRGHWQIQADLLTALALAGLARKSEASQRLRQVLDTAYRLGMVRTLLDEGKPLRDALLLLDCQDDVLLDSFRERLANAPLQSLLSEQPDLRGSLPGTSAEGLRLTRREQEIVELLDRSMSNKRIAQTLNLSLETVKWNLKNIYAKLGVTGRYEAIIAARQRIEA